MAETSQKTALQVLKDNKEKFHYYRLKDGTRNMKYVLYKMEPSLHANTTYLGTFEIHKNRRDLIFNKGLYNIFDSMVADMEDYNKTLPFDSAIYDPMYRVNARIEMALSDYLKELGLDFDWEKDLFVFRDIHGTVIFGLRFDVKEDTTNGKVQRFNPQTDNWSEATFTDLETAVAACNSLISIYAGTLNAQTAKLLSGLTESRVKEVLDKSIDYNNFQIITEDAREKAIAFMEAELKRLKQS